MSSVSPSITEAEILEQIVMPDQPGMPPEFARAISNLDDERESFDPAFRLPGK